MHHTEVKRPNSCSNGSGAQALGRSGQACSRWSQRHDPTRRRPVPLPSANAPSDYITVGGVGKESVRSGAFIRRGYGSLMKRGNAEGHGPPVASDTDSLPLLMTKGDRIVQRFFNSSARSPVPAEKNVCCDRPWTAGDPCRKRPLTTGCGRLYEGPAGDLATWLDKLDTHGAGSLRFTETGAGWML